MAISNVQAASKNDNGIAGTTSALAFASSNTATDLLVLTICWTARTTNVSVSDSLGNTWLPVVSKQTNNNSPELSNIQMFYVPNCKSGANTVTVTYSATGAFGVWTIAEYTNSGSSLGTWVLDKTQVNVATSAGTTSPTSNATDTLSQGLELVVGCIGTLRHNETFTAGSGFAIPTNGSTSANNQAQAQEWQAVSSVAAQTATMTFGTSSTYNAMVATFMPPGAAGVGINLVQHTSAIPASGTTIAYPANNTAGNMLLCCISSSSQAVPITAVTDSQGNTWHKLAWGVSAQDLIICVAFGCLGGANTVTSTVTFDGKTPISIYEFNGMASTFASGADTGNTSNGGATQTSITPSFGGDLVFGVSIAANTGATAPTITPSAGWTQTATQNWPQGTGTERQVEAWKVGNISPAPEGPGATTAWTITNDSFGLSDSGVACMIAASIPATPQYMPGIPPFFIARRG